MILRRKDERDEGVREMKTGLMDPVYVYRVVKTNYLADQAGYGEIKTIEGEYSTRREATKVIAKAIASRHTYEGYTFLNNNEVQEPSYSMYRRLK